MSSSDPTLIAEPKPPVLLGQRNASSEAPKPDRPKANTVTIDRLKNCRRVKPIVSSSGGTQATGARSSSLTGADSARRATTAARSTWRPLTRASASGRASSSPVTGRDRSRSRSRRAVSRLSVPVATPVSRRRDAANSSRPAARTSSGTAMARMVTVLMTLPRRSQLEEEAGVPREHEVLAGSPEERADHHEHRPEHEEDGEEGDRELTVLRLVGRVAVGVRRQDEPDEPQPRDRHAGDHGVEHGQQLLESQEAPGGRRRVRRLL